MRYMGGKSRVCKPIAAYINGVVGDRPYWEPFVGGGWVLQHVKARLRFASDLHGPLIRMWQALQSGWVPPSNVSEEEYRRLKADEAADPALRAFVGFGCSFGGKWFGGYARSDREAQRNYAVNAKNSLTRKTPLVCDVALCCQDFLVADPPEAGCLV